MTDTIETPEAVDSKVPAEDSLPEVARIFLERAKAQYSEIVKVSDKQKAGDNVGQLLADAIAASDNPDVVRARAAIEKANETILKASKAAEAIVKPTLDIPSEEDLKNLDEQYKKISASLTSYDTVFQTEVGKEFPELSIFAYLGEMPGAKKKGAKSGQGEGTSRPRVKSIEITSDLNGEQGWQKVEKDGKSTFTLLANKVKELTGETVGAGDFHEAWTDQNGKVDWSALPDTTTFSYSVTDAKQKVHQFMIRIGK